DGVLHVRVSNSSWMHALSFSKDEILRNANLMCGAPPLVKEVRLHLGAAQPDADDVVAALARRLRTRRKPMPARAAPSAEALRAIDAETDRVTDAELRDTIRALRRRIGM